MLRSTLLKAVAAAATLLAVLAVAPSRAATPTNGGVSAISPSVSWAGGPFLAINPTADTDCVVKEVPFCDAFTLEIGALAPTQPDVYVSVAADSSNDMINLAVYDASGTKVADTPTLGYSQTLVLRAPAPGTYSVRTELLLGTPGVSSYKGRAFAGVAGDPIDMSQGCLVEDQTVLLEPDDGRWVDLDVLVLLDGVDEAYARNFFAAVSIAYEELKIRVVPTFQAAVPGFDTTSAPDILNAARQRFPFGKVPAQYDIVEVLTSKDIQALGQAAVAGLADCLGGLAYDERSYNVSESTVPGVPDEGIAFGPLTLGANYAAKITAHEIGHLLGGQHHYANCVEGVDPATEMGDTSPCSLMFNSADMVSLHFGALNGKIARGYALKYATANDGDDPEPPVCEGKDKRKGCKTK